MVKISFTDFVQSFRAQFVTKRTYCRPLNEEGTRFETRLQMIDRTISHQRWLWETAKGKRANLDRLPLTATEEAEIEELRQIMLCGLGSLAGRTLWLGGTEISKRFQSTQFNCAFIQVNTVHDVVDLFHLLLLGCFHPETKIRMADGSIKEIGKVGVDDNVLSYNEHEDRFEEDSVVNVQRSLKEEKLELEFEDGTIVRCTNDHLFLTKNRGWVAAEDLSEDDDIVSLI